MYLAQMSVLEDENKVMLMKYFLIIFFSRQCQHHMISFKCSFIWQKVLNSMLPISPSSTQEEWEGKAICKFSHLQMTSLGSFASHWSDFQSHLSLLLYYYYYLLLSFKRNNLQSYKYSYPKKKKKEKLGWCIAQLEYREPLNVAEKNDAVKVWHLPHGT